MKSLTVRLKVVVSSAPVATRLRKFLTLSGAASGNIAISIAPNSVSSVTHWAAIFSTDAPSKGSGGLANTSAGLELAFLGDSTDRAGLVSCEFAVRVRRHEQTTESRSRREAMHLRLLTTECIFNSHSLLSHLNRSKHRARLVYRFSILVLWNRIGNNASACLHRRLAITQHNRPDGNARIKVVSIVHVQNCAGIDSPPVFFKFANDLHCPNLGSTSYSSCWKA